MADNVESRILSALKQNKKKLNEIEDDKYKLSDMGFPLTIICICEQMQVMTPATLNRYERYKDVHCVYYSCRLMNGNTPICDGCCTEKMYNFDNREIKEYGENS